MSRNTTSIYLKQEVYYVDLLNSIICGMVQFSNRWFDMTSMCLQACLMAPYDCDIFLFVVEHVICVIYVDYFILFRQRK